MPAPVLLDLFCGGGGAAMGYHRAGFAVVGIDYVPQPSYPFKFVRADAMRYPLDGFDAVHASPPCKRFTSARNRDRNTLRLFDPHDDLLTPTLARFAELGVPWVVENVPGSPMPAGSITLCGSSFGLDVRRHRLFASNVELVAPACDHAWQVPRFQSLENKGRKSGRLASVVGVHGTLQGGADTLALRQRALGIDWLDNDRLTQAIPPAFTEHIGAQLLATIGCDA
jgi:DNA (cytosine-5)-methyltransferase 1